MEEGQRRGQPSLLITRFLFYKNKLYKNTQAEIYPKLKNNLRTITRLKLDQKNLRNLFNPCMQIEMYMKTRSTLGHKFALSRAKSP